jgi:serine/threonine protein kinase
MNAVNPAAEAAAPKSCPSCGRGYPADALFCSLDGSPLTTAPGALSAAAKTDPYVGREILGHIEIRQLVGLGAMGRVYRAFQRGIDRDVAVKILHRELSANQMLVARFHREAKVASRLAHPNVVHVLVTGQLPDGALYIVMEYLDGMSLQSALAAAGGAMPLPRALHVALQLCDAAGEAHAHGVVHRDLKPENVMLIERADDPDYVKVLDFGIARLNWGEQSMATAAGLIFGTARYISPEGAQGEKVGPQGDVYAIATMVYQMLSARTPFDGENAVAMLVQQIHDSPPPLRAVERAAYVPEAIADVVMANLVKKIEGRADNARAFGRALLEAAVESGLNAQDFLARPGMLSGGRGLHSSIVTLPPLQKTTQLRLEPDVAERMTLPKTKLEPPGDTSVEQPEGAPRTVLKTEVPDPANGGIAAAIGLDARGGADGVAPGAKTTKWISPPGFDAKLAPPAAGQPPGQAMEAMQGMHEARAGIPTPPPSGVDLTMDEQQLGTPPPSRSPLATPPPSRSPLATPLIPTAVPSSPGDTAPPMSRTAPPSSRPPSFVDTTIAGDEAPERLPRTSGRAVAVVVACFFLGVVAAGGLAWRAGLLGGHAQEVDYAALASQAAAHNEWEAVRDLTDKGLARAPRDASLLRIRAQASADALIAANGRRTAGDLAAALRLARLAAQMEAKPGAAAALVDDLTAPPPEPAPTESLPPLANGRAAPGSASAAANAAHASLDVSASHPGVGQPVDLAGRVRGAAAHPRVEGPSFLIAGPGIAAGTRLEAADDGSGVYRATFTFLQDGRYDVTFVARSDGAPVRAARPVVVGVLKQQPPPLPPGPGEAPTATAPTSSVRWM